MKKTSCILLAACFLFFAACGTGADAPDPTGLLTQDVFTGQTGHPSELETVETKDLPLQPVPEPLTPERLAEIPVANASMTTEELREICVKFFELSGSFQWTPSDSVSYLSHDQTKTREFKRGVVYGGLPYTQASLSLYHFLEHYDPGTGILNSSPYKLNFDGAFGNDCADALFWAWARVSNTISFSATAYMQPARGCVPLGNYTYNTDIKDFAAVGGTRKVCTENGMETMCESYALFQPADGMVTWNSSGHARMVVSNHPVRGADGKIDSKASYVICMEQVSSLSATKQNGKMVQVQSGYHKKYTYAQLFKSGYLPVTAAEFLGTDPVESAAATLDVPENADFETLTKAELKVNYRLAMVHITIRDEAGNVVFQSTKNGSQTNLYSIPMKEVLRRNTMLNYLKGDGTFTLTLTATIGNGETIPVYTGTLGAIA